MEKLNGVLKKIYSYGVLACLFLGGTTVLGYGLALCIGGETATLICTFIYKKLFVALIIAMDVFALLGLVTMYLSGQKTMIMRKK